MATSTITAAVRQFAKKKERQIQEAMRESMRYMLRGTKQRLNVSARVGSKGKKYQASKPGEYPRKRTGSLTKSLRTRVEKSGDETVGIMGTTIEHSRYLEGGTKDMEARPIMRKAIKDCTPGVRRIFRKHLKR